jgi:uncharacterized protein YqiB (DUF1249 family)
MKPYPMKSQGHSSVGRIARKPRYQLDFGDHMACCEENFQRLQRLLPLTQRDDHWQFGIDAPGQLSGRIELSVIERSRFTTTLSITQYGLLTWLGAHQLVVRMYHDARVAEVIACKKGRQLREYYNYPNCNMFHEDEKVQLNRYLGEWLSHCLRYGHSLNEIVLA